MRFSVYDFVCCWGGLLVFVGVFFMVEVGEVLVLCGLNGVGKMMFLCMFVGL